ncbi:hypothetical protein GCM10027034_27220 [Ramlibacter solisilvae]|uniref:Lipoprotein n=1 Tax=Ramlibacter tataouinensis TaxID=94132 RepID=A0A127JQR2_9BURK|nr:hypothetical protein [Ramlibacter tataouinensis]AMO22378.1 hypothetical protein UC35_05030 [Ramlibacter tataouinensis]
MMSTARTRFTCLASLAACLAGCVGPTLQSAYQFQQHPGVAMEVWWQYSPDGVAYTVSNLVNRGSVDKCAWTDQQPSRVLRAGETWTVSQVQGPGNVGVSNVMSFDPSCVNAKRDYGRR